MTRRRLAGNQAGLSLIVTLVVTAGVAVIVASILCLSASRSSFTRRISQYDRSLAAAVAATQKVQKAVVNSFSAL